MKLKKILGIKEKPVYVTAEMAVEKAKKEAEQLRQQENIAKGKKIELFLGSLAEYEQLKGKKYEIIDTGSTKKFFHYSSDKSDLKYLGNLGVEALVRFQDGFYATIKGYGIPVREKKEK